MLCAFPKKFLLFHTKLCHSFYLNEKLIPYFRPDSITRHCFDLREDFIRNANSLCSIISHKAPDRTSQKMNNNNNN